MSLNNKKILNIFTVILFFALLFLLYKIGSFLWIRHENNNINKDIRNQYYDYVDKSETFRDRYSSLLKENNEIVGWITIVGTKVDYPVVRAENNDFYLNYNFKKESSEYGAIFMDFRNDGSLSKRNNIIYGHNMKDGSMFHELAKYKDINFFKEHPIIEFDTLDEPVKWQIFSLYVTDTKFNYIKTDFNDDDYIDFLAQLKEQSMYDTGIGISKEDIILTLSTCTYEFDDARFVVHAKRIK